MIVCVMSLRFESSAVVIAVLFSLKVDDRIDFAAAVIILQSALDAERASGRPPGRVLEQAIAANAEHTRNVDRGPHDTSRRPSR